MKKIALMFIVAGLLSWIGSTMLVEAQDKPTPVQHYEYAAIRYYGGDKVIIVFPDGTPKLLSELVKYNRPKWADDRSYNLIVAVNYLAKQGYETVQAGHFDVNDVWMRRDLTTH